MDLGFVILHYKVFEMTERCIDTIIKIFEKKDIHIVVVDNGSANYSGEKLREKYHYNTMVDVILCDENLGFACGNNIGYKYIVEKYNPQYIVVMNNDVIINDNKFIDKIDEIYKNTGFAVLGPDIINPIYLNHQNPISDRARTIEEVKKRIHIFEIRYRYAIVFWLISSVKKIVVKNETIREKDYKHSKENVVLHGACLILSRDFITNRKYCFNPNTFLYHEEDILFFECMKQGLKMVYSPKLCVKHLEDVATDATLKSGYKKMKIRNKWLSESAKVLLGVITEE